MTQSYDEDGLRAWKEDAQGVRTYFLYDGERLVGEFDQSGMMQASQTWGAEGLAYRRTASGASAGNRFYSWDVRGNIAATTDATGAVVNTPSSDGFSSSGGTEPCATFGGQVGGYRDSETGLVLFGQRYYDPSLGSWLTRDPIAEEGGINLYSYVQGNPTNFVDPTGLHFQVIFNRAHGTITVYENGKWLYTAPAHNNTLNPYVSGTIAKGGGPIPNGTYRLGVPRNKGTTFFGSTYTPILNPYGRALGIHSRKTVGKKDWHLPTQGCIRTPNNYSVDIARLRRKQPGDLIVR